MSDRRRHARTRDENMGMIVTSCGRPVSCRLVDRSESGAKLSLFDASALPDQFDLLIVGSGEMRAAQVIWRQKDVIGVAFA